MIIPDQFQLDAFAAIDDGSHVIVAAPTGAGKTLVAEHAVQKALRAGRRVFYTTPIKALSNQKFADLSRVHGSRNVGLLTGDNVINANAPVVVMTTEVLRNMLYAGADLDALSTVILDEVHYLQDSYRGPVWEEVIIHLPHRVALVCLSATVSNAVELSEWIETVRGSTQLVVETKRPVELENLYLVGEKGGRGLTMIKTLHSNKPNAKGFRFDNFAKSGRGKGNRYAGKRNRPKWRTPTRVESLIELRDRDLLPAIHFIFSRAGCDDAAQQVVNAGISLTSSEERAELRSIARERSGLLTETELKVVQFDRFLHQLEAGVAAHHAGMVPAFKETVEVAFSRGLVKMVFATETLALGINMPARTVIIDKLTKFTGDHHEFLTPAQYTQLTGRAGRRGIDTHGQAVVLWSPWVSFDQVAGLAASREFVLKSAFRPTYNMAANLVRRYEPDRARQLLNLSFAQFQSNAGVVRVEHNLEKLLDRQEQIANRIEREFGPISSLRAALKIRGPLDEDTADIAFALSELSPGQIIAAAGPGLPPHLLVLSVAYRKGGRITVKCTDVDSNIHEVVPSSLDEVPKLAGSIALPEPYLPNSVSFIFEASQDLARARLVAPKRRTTLGSGESGLTSAEDVPPGARKGLRRLERIENDIDRLKREVRRDADSLARQFDSVIEVLELRGHLEGWNLTDSGVRLARLYHEADLLIVEALEEGLFDGLTSAEVAALASTFGYEDRRPGVAVEPWFPTAEVRRRFTSLLRLHQLLSRTEKNARLPGTRAPDAGFMGIAHAWASGGDLDDVLGTEEMTAGDFVRTAKQLIDVLRQIGQLAPVPTTQKAAREAADAVFRDLVAASSMVASEET